MTYIVLLIAFIIMAVMWWRARAAAEVAIELCARESIRANIAAERSVKYREALEQSYVGLQALAEKSIEAEWIRSGEGLVPAGVWVGDDFIPVEASEVGDVEVGSQATDGVTDPKPEFPHNGGGRCWCGGPVGRREPGDDFGLGCLANINHEWLEGGPTRERFRSMP